MKLSADEYQGALRQKRMVAGESSRPAKKVRRREPAGPTPSARDPVAPVIADKPIEGPSEEVPAEQTAPEPTEVGAEGEDTAVAAETAATVVNVGEDESAAVDASGAGQTATAGNPPDAAGPEVEQTPPPAEGEGNPRAAVAGPVSEPREAESGRAAGKDKEPEGSARQSEPCPVHPQEGGSQERTARPGPVAVSMSDAGQAARLLAQIPTPESVKEVRGMNTASTVDMLMVSMVQTVNGVMGLREVLARTSSSLSQAIEKVKKYKKANATHKQLLQESLAREEDLKNRQKETEIRASSFEGKLELALAKIKGAQARSEEQGRRLQQAEERVLAAQEETRATMEKVISAEKLVAEAKLEKAGAISFADEAGARAEEAEQRAWEAESRAKKAEARALQAEARLEKAIENYKLSPEFKKEVVETSLDAYVKGFDLCKARMTKAFNINDPKLDSIQPEGEQSEEEEEEEDGGNVGASKP